MVEWTKTNPDEMREREPATDRLPHREQRRRRLLLLTAVVTLVVLVTAGLIVERTAHTPLVRVGQWDLGAGIPL